MYGPLISSRSSSRVNLNDSTLSKSVGDAPGFHFHNHVSRTTSEVSSISYCGYLLKRSNSPIRNWQKPSENDSSQQQQHTNKKQAVFAQASYSSDDGKESKPFPVHNGNGVIHEQVENLSVSKVKKTTRCNQKINATENCTMDQLSRFFGIQVSKAEKPVKDTSNIINTPCTPSNNTHDSISSLYTPPKTTTKSIPIPVNGGSTEIRNHRHRRNSVPISQNTSPPSDWINPNDGHIWRAKYCILLDGYLYFYRSEEDGESSEATQERSRCDSNLSIGESNDLSKSPLPRNFMNSTSAIPSSNESNEAHEIWEKRVTLRDVVAVHSAEIAYGDFAFELQAETGDRLILKAGSNTALNEWLFQFHRSLSSFIREYVDAWSKVNVVDLHLSSQYNAKQKPCDKIKSLDFWLKANPSPALSVPHGSGIHRRRKSDIKEDTAILERKVVESIAPKTSPNGDNKIDFSKSCLQPPETENNMKTPPKKVGMYIPPSRRRRMMEEDSKQGLSSSETKRKSSSDFMQPKIIPADSIKVVVEPCFISQQPGGMFRGGCADPSVVIGSILDDSYKKRNSSLVTTSSTQSFGCYGGGSRTENHISTLHWEVGAKNVCGVRTSNEDAFFICHDARKILQDGIETLNDDWGKHEPGMFGIFDGHCGNEAARFATERLAEYFYREWKQLSLDHASDRVKIAMHRALDALDQEFCRLCVEDGRTWESGSTAIVATIIDGELFVTSLGDCRAVMCRSVAIGSNTNADTELHHDGWTLLETDGDLNAQWSLATSDAYDGNNDPQYRDSYWKEVAEVHTLAREDEKRRIAEANGWVTAEKDVQYGQMQRMDLCDKDVLEILQRCFSEQYLQSQSSQQKKNNSIPKMVSIERVCGDLAVTRAIGDRLFKAQFNQKISDALIPPEEEWWICPQSIPLPKDHSGIFKGDLVSSVAETRVYKIFLDSYIDEFLLLACDGFWDVIDPDDAVRVTRELLLVKKCSAKKAAERLAELAVHLGSSDNITVIIIRFFCATSKEIKEFQSKNSIL